MAQPVKIHACPNASRWLADIQAKLEALPPRNLPSDLARVRAELKRQLKTAKTALALCLKTGRDVPPKEDA